MIFNIPYSSNRALAPPNITHTCMCQWKRGTAPLFNNCYILHTAKSMFYHSITLIDNIMFHWPAWVVLLGLPCSWMCLESHWWVWVVPAGWHRWPVSASLLSQGTLSASPGCPPGSTSWPTYRLSNSTIITGYYSL